MGIEGVQARVSQILNRIDEKLAAPSARFQSILNEKLGIVDTAGSTAVSTVDSSATQAAGDGSALGSGTGTLDSSGALTATGRYCSICGLPEYTSTAATHSATAGTAANSVYYSQYAAAVDTSDGMIQKAAPYMDIIEEASSVYGVPVNVIMGVIKAESDYNPQCVSSAGAMGLMQIMPVNAQEFGVTDAFDPYQNIFCGVDEIARHLQTYNGDLRVALAAYNTGPGNVAARGVTSSNSAEYMTIPQSVRDYVERVFRYAGLE